MKSKIYFILTLILSIAYFVDVFIGMFMIQRNYTDNAGRIFYSDARYQALMNETYIIIEIVFLGIMVVEDVSKLALCTRLSGKRVTMI